jgi:hypothetical protein
MSRSARAIPANDRDRARVALSASDPNDTRGVGRARDEERRSDPSREAGEDHRQAGTRNRHRRKVSTQPTGYCPRIESSGATCPRCLLCVHGLRIAWIGAHDHEC